MNETLLRPCTAFDGHRRLAAGSFLDVALAVRKATDSGADGPVLIYDDRTGEVVDIDRRGTAEQTTGPAESTTGEARGRGRPNLGVIGREVTLLPRHWDWLNAQPGGASVALRRLVDEARRTRGDRDRTRAAQEAAYRFMSAMAGNFPGFEEAARALFAYDRRRFGDLVAAWPEDVREYVVQLAFADHDPAGN